MEEVNGIRDCGKRGLMGAQGGEPTHDVRIALQLLERLHLRILSLEKIQEIADCAIVEAERVLIEGSGDGLGRALKQGGQWMPDRREPVHSRIGKVGRISCAAARAYCSKTSRGEICT
jgi:hypothetical protein